MREAPIPDGNLQYTNLTKFIYSTPNMEIIHVVVKIIHHAHLPYFLKSLPEKFLDSPHRGIPATS